VIASSFDSFVRMNDWNAQIIAEFRANGGKAAQFGDNPLVILHTIGAKSGELREIPLVTFVDGDDLYVFASKGGAPTNPDWYYNLKANPQITVEYGTETFTATVTELPEDEGQAKLRAQAELMPQFGEYITSAAPRVIPAFHIART
jgi:deazaflavin-dependent oxidoreductase (nitroreductase family)